MKVRACDDNSGLLIEVRPSDDILAGRIVSIQALAGGQWVKGAEPFVDRDGDFLAVAPLVLPATLVWFPAGALPRWSGPSDIVLVVQIIDPDRKAAVEVGRFEIRPVLFTWREFDPLGLVRPWIGLAVSVAYASGAISGSAVRVIKSQFVTGPDDGVRSAIVRGLAKAGPISDISALVAASRRRLPITPAALASLLGQIAEADGLASAIVRRQVRAIAEQFGPEFVTSCEARLGEQPTETRHWETLGLAPAASMDEAKRAYRRMALTYHPDRHQNLPPDMQAVASKRMSEINAAWEAIESTDAAQTAHTDHVARTPRPDIGPSLEAYGAAPSGPWHELAAPSPTKGRTPGWWLPRISVRWLFPLGAGGLLIAAKLARSGAMLYRQSSLGHDMPTVPASEIVDGAQAVSLGGASQQVQYDASVPAQKEAAERVRSLEAKIASVEAEIRTVSAELEVEQTRVNSEKIRLGQVNSRLEELVRAHPKGLAGQAYEDAKATERKYDEDVDAVNVGVARANAHVMRLQELELTRNEFWAEHKQAWIRLTQLVH